MKKIITRLFLKTTFAILSLSAKAVPLVVNNIKLHINFTSSPLDSFNIELREWGCYKQSQPSKTATLKGSRGNLSWSTSSKTPLSVTLRFFNSREPLSFLVLPGDSVLINVPPDQLLAFSGRGSYKAKIKYDINNSLKKLEKISLSRKIDISEFHRQNKHIDSATAIINAKLDSAGNRLPSDISSYIRAELLSQTEKDRIFLFQRLIAQNTAKLSAQQLCYIYDSIIVNANWKWLCNLTIDAGSASFLFNAALMQSKRNKGFISEAFETDGKERSLMRREQTFREAKKMYKGMALSNATFYIVGYEGFQAFGFNHITEKMLQEFFSDPAIAEKTKVVMKTLEREARKNSFMRYGLPLDNRYKDSNGNIIEKKKMEKKIVLLNFYDPAETPSYSAILQATYKDNPNIIIANIPVENKENASYIEHNDGNPQQWHFVKEVNDSILKYEYGITKLPTVFLFDQLYPIKELSGVTSPSPQQIAAAIDKRLVYKNDGPYVFQTQNQIQISSFKSDHPQTQFFDTKEKIKIRIQTDEVEKFLEFSLKDTLMQESCRYEAPSKLFVISDIEGNFKALRELLQSNNIIDNKCNWIFGSGHLAIAGDVFDRGWQVTECLWLIYALEEQAKRHKGKVHLIIGNHEIMNLMGEISYTQKKYKDNTAALNLSYRDLFGPQSELGRWLRTKNVIEKIGDLLLVHGGIGMDLIKLNLPLQDINSIAINQIDSPSINNAVNDLITGKKTAPYWYRGYYQGQDSSIRKELSATLALYDAKTIITGHTIVNEITPYYNGQLFNTDTHHAGGNSQGLLIQDDTFFRVNEKGEKQVIWSRKKN